ncbi:nickel transporter [Streptomyces sp. MUM 136J]|uniref:nickel/cobalt transporter n=1 Tax=Streptomyces sp. MUM 136J TaxID=2791992 RepID=UPI001F03C120|nr:nickel transporter [Streptomyces sp. MUM 136J]MCH0569797.1 nickel transporter [Streptomyces sp. MUM 136J]
MTPRRVLGSAAAVLTAAAGLALLPAASASAHPLGNFTVNRYDGLVAAPGSLRVDHVEDLAEIPATQARPELERLGAVEWARQRCRKAAQGSRVVVDGRPVALTARSSRVHVRPGQAGLNTLRVECRLTAPLPDASVAVAFHSAGGDTGPGWREITARGDRMTLTASDVPERSSSGQLTHYPRELLSSPADTATASLRVRPGGPALAGGAAEGAAAVLPRGADRFTRALDALVARRDLTLGFAALALFIAVGLGALHALAPGHGKTLMAATAAARGGRARLKDVLPLAASVTVTHTLGVVALGLLVTAGSAAAPSVIAWLGMASGCLVMLAGATLVRRALRNRTRTHTHGHAPHTHDAAGRPHDHGGGPAHHHDHVQGHSHSHPHAHAHGEAHAHRDEPAHGHAHDHGGGSGRAREHPHVHRHGGIPHTHSTAPTLRGTLLLGFAGGLVPSPSAIVVLVGAAALGKAWFGLVLVVAYGAGLALTLTAAGFAVVRVGSGMSRLLDRRPRWTAHPLTGRVRRAVPLGSASVVLALGAGLVLRGAASALG